jgi:hypothetical protein
MGIFPGYLFKWKYSQKMVNFPKVVHFDGKFTKNVFFFMGNFYLWQYYCGINDKNTYAFKELFPHALNKTTASSSW